MTIVPEHQRLEIGWTWVGTAFQRTGANREAKLLQLTPRVRDARRQPRRVQDPLPGTSGRGPRWPGIGATFEGVFRNHTIMPDGSIRDSAYFSVIADGVAGGQGARSIAGLAAAERLVALTGTSRWGRSSIIGSTVAHGRRWPDRHRSEDSS